MPTLTLKFKENVVGEFSLEKGSTLTIGRLDDNHVVIENLAVSGHHAKVDAVGDGYLLTDLQSKNGSFVNDQVVTAHWLKHGDVISLGPSGTNTYVYYKVSSPPLPDVHTTNGF